MVFNALEEDVEDTLKADPELYERYFTNCKIQDFKIGDYVKCMYLKGYLKIIHITYNRLQIQYGIPYNVDDIYEVDPIFTKKVKLDEKWIKILYDN